MQVNAIRAMFHWTNTHPDARVPAHVFLDEAQRYLPQSLGDSVILDRTVLSALLKCYLDLITIGGKRGLAPVILTKRFAQVNKKIMAQSEVFFLLRQTHDGDLERCMEYVKSEVASKEQIARFQLGQGIYSGYQLLPGVPHVPAAIDAAALVIQQGALDIGSMGLLKLARRAGLSRDSFPVRLGTALVVLMILNMVLASVKHTVPMIPDGVFVGIETLLLIARAVVAVLFRHAIHALREEYGESTITLKEATELQQRLEDLSSKLAQVQQDFQRQLASKLSSLRETFQQSQDELAQVPNVKAHLHRLESSTVEELWRVKTSLEQQRQNRPTVPAQQEARPVLRALPSLQQGKRQGDVRAFVFTCLQEAPDLKLAEIEQRAHAAGQELSQPTAKPLPQAVFASRESAPEVYDESSAMKVQAVDESPVMKAESGDESRAVGE